MTTSKRSNDYQCLLETLKSLKKSGFNESDMTQFGLDIFDTGGAPERLRHEIEAIIPTAKLHRSETTYNLFDNHIRAFEYGSQCAEWFLFLEDDIAFTHRFVESILYAINHCPDDAGCISFFTCQPLEHFREKTNTFFYRYPPERFWGAQCLLFRSLSMKWYLNSNVRWNHQLITQIPSQHIDLSIGCFFYGLITYSLYAFVPCLVQHMGGSISSVGHQGERKSPYFRGEDFDLLDHYRLPSNE